MARKHRKWVKLWSHWYTRIEHLGLSADALALGGPLMLLADASWEMETGTATVPPIGAICRLARTDETATATAMEELISAGTLERNAGGAIVWPDYGEEQETAQAARTRRYRESRVTVTTRYGHGDAECDGQSHGSVTTEGRGEKEKEKEKEDGDHPKPPKGGKHPRSESHHPDTAEALALLNDARLALAEKRSKQVRPTKSKAVKAAISGRLNDGATLDDVRNVLAWLAWEAAEFKAGRRTWDPADFLLGAIGVFGDEKFNKRADKGAPPKAGANATTKDPVLEKLLAEMRGEGA